MTQPSLRIHIKGENIAARQIMALHGFIAFTWVISSVLPGFLLGLSSTPQSGMPATHPLQWLPYYFWLGLGLLLTVVFLIKKIHRFVPLNLGLRVFELLLTLPLLYFGLTMKAWILVFVFGLLILALVVAMILESKAHHSVFIEFSKKGMSCPAPFFRKSIPWSDIEALRWRHQTLSVVFTDKKIQQWITQNGKYAEEDLLAIFEKYK